MSNLLDEIKSDLNYLRSHTLQPKWFKLLKIFILLGFLIGYYALFGGVATLLFLSIFLLLSVFIHLTYRHKTNRWTSSWLDFVVIEENNKLKTKRIGKFYYSAIFVNVLLSVAISLWLT